jgi:CHAT domain-containing protein
MYQAYRRMITRLRDTPGTAHPFYWSAFVAAGDWR